MNFFSAIALLVICGGIYFFPSLWASYKKKKNHDAIFALNLFLGWTFIGWVIALVWAATKD